MPAPQKPDAIPEPGFYYHYKHDPNGPIDNYAYEVLNVGLHTEDDCRPEDQWMVIYRPLYESALVYGMGKRCDLRPLAMFMEKVGKGGRLVDRFQKITDASTIAAFEEIKRRMYGS